jgi:cation diffusion facilitator family transporter
MIDLQAGRRIAAMGIVASALLATMNVVIGLSTQSVSVLATGFEFAGDVFASSVVLVGLLVAGRPADANHPYGHGRTESLSAFVVGVVLAAGGVGICWRSLHQVGIHHPPPAVSASIALTIAIVVRGGMSALKFRVGRQLQSAALVADAWNDAVDILSAGAALTAVALARYNPDRFSTADHYGGFVVGVVVIVTGVRVLKDASMDLIDTMPDPSALQQVSTAALGVPGVLAIEQVRARKTGLRWHVDIHVEVDPELTVRQSHDIATDVRARIGDVVPWVADTLVHIEPHR